MRVKDGIVLPKIKVIDTFSIMKHLLRTGLWDSLISHLSNHEIFLSTAVSYYYKLTFMWVNIIPKVSSIDELKTLKYTFVKLNNTDRYNSYTVLYISHHYQFRESIILCENQGNIINLQLDHFIQACKKVHQYLYRCKETCQKC